MRKPIKGRFCSEFTFLTKIDCGAVYKCPALNFSKCPPTMGVAPNQLFTWRRLVALGALTAAGSGEEVVPASDYRALQSKVRELQRLLGKKTRGLCQCCSPTDAVARGFDDRASF
jgi:transposase-like protein